ncbi:MAG: response regulator [Pseudomonadota bacterium]
MPVIVPTPNRSVDLGRCHPLVVAPYSSNRRLLRDILNDLGVGSVESCADIPEAWDILCGGLRNMLFIDWSDHTDAVNFLRMLRIPSNPLRFLPVVVFSAYGDMDHVSLSRDSGATEFMLRPFSKEVVASRLRSITQAPRLFVQSDDFFGPDRRRRRADFSGPERRRHANWRAADRRTRLDEWSGVERRQGLPGFREAERRGHGRFN